MKKKTGFALQSEQQRKESARKGGKALWAKIKAGQNEDGTPKDKPKQN